MEKRIKRVTAHIVQHKHVRKEIIFRVLVTILEVIPGVLVAVFTDLGMPEKVAIASAIGAVISAIVNVIKQLEVVDPNSLDQEGEGNA